MTEINREYILRLYAIHERMMDAASELNHALARGASHDVPPAADALHKLTDEMEAVFAEVLADEERGIPTDEEFSMMVNKLIGKENDQ